MARKTSAAPTRIWSFGALPPTSNAKAAQEALFLANRYGNALIEIERNRVAAYQATRRRHAPGLCVAEEEVAAIDAEIEDLLTAIREQRAGTFRSSGQKTRVTSPEHASALATLKARRKGAAARRKAARTVFEDTMGPAREEHKRRRETIGASLVSASGIVGPRVKERVNAEVLVAMLAEDWPVAWKELQQVDADAVEKKKHARAARPVSAGLGGLVETAIEQAIKDARKPTRPDGSPKKPGPPRFRRFRGEGRLGGQIRDGDCTVAELMGGTDSVVRIRPATATARAVRPEVPPAGFRWSRSGKTLQRCAEHERPDEVESFVVGINIGSDERGAATWVEFPVRLHRMLPDDAVVKYAWVSVRKVGSRQRYELQLTIEAPSFGREKRSFGTGQVAVNFGWRQAPDGIRVGYWVSSSGETGEIVMRGRAITGPGHADALRGHADSSYALVLRVLRACLSLAGHDFGHWERMTSERNRTALVRYVRSFATHRLGEQRLAALWDTWRKERLGSRSDLFDTLTTADRWGRAHGLLLPEDRLAFWLTLWSHKDWHLREYEAGQRRRTTARRDEFYRNEAIGLSKQFGELVVDDTNYAKIARTGADEEAPSADKNRQKMAPGRFREIMREVFGEKRTVAVKSTDNTAHCAGCREKLEIVVGKSTADCSYCGRLDVDANNCRNMLRRAPDGDRSGGDPPPGGARKAEGALDDGVSHAAE